MGLTLLYRLLSPYVTIANPSSYVPLYFQVTARASTTTACLHLVPAVVGSTISGFIAGTIIKRTGRYKILLVLSGLISFITYILLFFCWNGSTGMWESFYILFAGLGTGISSGALFVAMVALLAPTEVAMATAGYMLFFCFAMTMGATITNNVLGAEFRTQLQKHFHGPGSQEVRWNTAFQNLRSL